LSFGIDIRSLFTPSQPTVRQQGQQVSYHEFLPDSKLIDFIYCYWRLQTDSPLEEAFTYRVVADGCIDVFFEATNPEECFVMGFCKKYTEFELANHFNYIGIRFLPTIFTQLFGVDASELSNQSLSLELVVPELFHYIVQAFHSSSGERGLQSQLDRFFLQHLTKVKFEKDDRFYDALSLILRKQGTLRVETDLNTGLSPRQLRRKFNYYVGTTPKTFGKIVRFQHILRAKPSTQSLRKNKLFFDVGYYDQAHFIKEFKNLYGVKPSIAFGR